MSVARHCGSQKTRTTSPGLDQDTKALHRVVSAGGDTGPSFGCIKSLMRDPGFPDGCKRLPWIYSYAVVVTKQASLHASVVKQMRISETESNKNAINKMKKVL